MAFVRRKGSFAECWTLFQILQLFCQNVGLFSHNIGLVCQSTGSFDNEQHVGPTVVANFMPWALKFVERQGLRDVFVLLLD